MRLLKVANVILRYKELFCHVDYVIFYTNVTVNLERIPRLDEFTQLVSIFMPTNSCKKKVGIAVHYRRIRIQIRNLAV
jgi:hypothetical protein